MRPVPVYFYWIEKCQKNKIYSYYNREENSLISVLLLDNLLPTEQDSMVRSGLVNQLQWMNAFWTLKPGVLMTKSNSGKKDWLFLKEQLLLVITLPNFSSHANKNTKLS